MSYHFVTTTIEKNNFKITEMRLYMENVITNYAAYNNSQYKDLWVYKKGAVTNGIFFDESLARFAILKDIEPT